MWSALARAEGLTLLEADNQTGYFCVYHQHGKCKPYKAEVLRRGKLMYLGNFVTAEEAALCVARTPEGRKAAKRPAAAPPLSSQQARQQAEAEGLTLLKADNKTGYFGVYHSNVGKPKPYTAQVKRAGKSVILGCFATLEQAALCIGRSPEGRAAAEKAAAAPPAPPLTSEEIRQQAQAEGLTLLRADNKTGYFCVGLNQPDHPKPFQARVWRGRKKVSLGCFATAEEAALCVARSPEWQAAAERAAERAAAPPVPAGEAARTPVPLTIPQVERQAACATRRKALLGRWQQVLTALAARATEERGRNRRKSVAREGKQPGIKKKRRLASGAGGNHRVTAGA